MADRMGNYTFMGLGKQSAWLTAVARTVWVPLLSTTMQRKQKWVERETLAQSTSFNRRKWYLSEDRSGGTCEILMTYEGLGLVLENLLGADVSTTGTGPYTHVFAISATPQTGGLSVEVQRGTGTSELFFGGRISKAVFSLEAGKEMKASLDFVCRSANARTTAVTPTWTSSREYVVSHLEAGTLLFNSVAYVIDKMTLTVDNKLAGRQSLGSALVAELPRSGSMEVTLELEVIVDSDAFMTAHTAHTESDATIVFTSLEAAGDSFTIVANKCFVDKFDDPISSAAVIKQKILLRCQADSTDEGVKFTIVSGQANGLAN